MSDELLSFEEHRRRRDENPSLVRCARCGKMILATTSRCPECGIYFQGEAQEYTHSSERDADSRRISVWMLVMVVALLVALLLSAVGLP